LIGAKLIWGCSGVVVETEAYNAINDEACHTFMRSSTRLYRAKQAAGRGLRLFQLWDALDAERARERPENGFVLIRALEPKSGVEGMKRRRKLDDVNRLCSGPGKLTQALDITDRHHEMDLCSDPRHCFARNAEATVKVVAGQRIGITRSAHLPWRFTLAASSLSAHR
jgi:DNA-3-methyladenine glycosylase